MARAPALQAGGQEFDSPHLHQVELMNFKKIFNSIIVLKYNRVVQGNRIKIFEIIRLYIEKISYED